MGKMNKAVSRRNGHRDYQGTEKESKILSVLKALLTSYLVTAIFLFILAGLLYKFNLDENAISIGITAIYILSTFLGGIALGKMVKTRRFMWGFILGLCYFALLLLITLGVYRTVDTTGVNLITTFLLCAGGGMIGGMIS